jgi:hypothetical protein
MAIMNNNPLNDFDFKYSCRIKGDTCQETSDCCSQLNCYSIQSRFFLRRKKVKYSWNKLR